MNRMKKNPIVLILFLTLFYTGTFYTGYTGTIDASVSSQYAGQDSNIETAYISTFSLPDKSRAIIKKYFPNIQLELGEVPAPYHHMGREKLLT